MASTSLIVAAGRYQPREHLSAWETAKARFLEGLDENERALFHDATPENLLYTASNAQKQDVVNSKTRRLFTKMDRFISAVETYGKAIDVYAQISPLHLAPIWGSVRVVLILANKHSQYYARIIDVFEKIGEILPRFEEYEKLFVQDDHPRFAEVLSKVYLDIIDLCTRLKHDLQEQKISRRKRLFRPLSTSGNSQLEDAVDRFRNHRKTVDKEAAVCHMIEEKKSRELALRNKEEDEMRIRLHRQKDLISRLSDIDPYRKHRQMQRLRLQGTGEWARPSFQEWANTLTTALLCCTGIPGSGKSVLSSQLFDLAKDLQPFGSCLLFYCDYAEKQSLRPISIIRNLCQQLLGNLGACPIDLLNKIERFIAFDGSADTDDMVGLTKEIIDHSKISYIFIDGIDEMEIVDQKIVVKYLLDLVSTNDQCAPKLYLSSRDELKHLTCFPQELVLYTIRTDEQMIGADIKAFVEHSVQAAVQEQNLDFGDAALHGEVVRALVSGSKGMFLWVKFQILELYSAQSDHAIRAMLHELPRDLGETYDRYLRRLQDRKHESTLLTRMFEWLLCARRPLKLEEVREAVAFTTENKEYDSTLLPTNLHKLTATCGHLVMIDPVTSIVHFAHYTVQQHLLDGSRSSGAPFLFQTLVCENRVGARCLSYLSFSDFERQVTKYHDSGVTAHFTVIEKAVSRPIAPGKVGNAATRTLNGWISSKKPGLEIDYARYLDRANQKREQTLDQFALLQYIIDNWLYHTASFDQDLSKTAGILGCGLHELRRSFVHTAFNGSFSFDLRPWDTIKFIPDECKFLYHIDAALNFDNSLLMVESLRRQTPPHTPEGFPAHSHSRQSIPPFLQNINSWLARSSDYFAGTICKFQNQLLVRLHDIYGRYDEVPPLDKDTWYVWLFYRMMIACQEHRIAALGILVNSYSKPSDALRGHVLLYAVLQSCTPLIEVMCSGYERWQLPPNISHLRSGPLGPGIWPRTIWNELDCSVFELAYLIGSRSTQDTITSISRMKPAKHDFVASLISSTLFADAIKQRDGLKVQNILLALGVSREDLEDIDLNSAFYHQSEDTRMSNLMIAIDIEIFSPIPGSKPMYAVYDKEKEDVRFCWIQRLALPDKRDRVDLILYVDSANDRRLPPNVVSDIIIYTIRENEFVRQYYQTVRDSRLEDTVFPLDVITHVMDHASKEGDGSEWFVDVRNDNIIQARLTKSGMTGQEYIPLIQFAILYSNLDITKMLSNRRYYAPGDNWVLSPSQCAILVGDLDILRFTHSKKNESENWTFSYLNENWYTYMLDFAKKHWPTDSSTSNRAALKELQAWGKQATGTGHYRRNAIY